MRETLVHTDLSNGFRAIERENKTLPGTICPSFYSLTDETCWMGHSISDAPYHPSSSYHNILQIAGHVSISYDNTICNDNNEGNYKIRFCTNNGDVLNQLIKTIPNTAFPSTTIPNGTDTTVPNTGESGKNHSDSGIIIIPEFGIQWLIMEYPCSSQLIESLFVGLVNQTVNISQEDTKQYTSMNSSHLVDSQAAIIDLIL